VGVRKRISRGLFSALLLLSVSFCFLDNANSEEPIELRISHFGPSDYVQQTQVLEPWVKKIEKLTQGRVKFTIFSDETLGKAADEYDLVVKGKVDIALSVPGYTLGRFPLMSCMSLPFIGTNGEKASLVVWRLYQKFLQDEFKDVKVLWLFSTTPFQLHTIKNSVKTLEDLKGLRIRVSPSLSKAMERLGVIPIIVSLPDGYKLMKEGKLDGVITPWEAALSFKFFDMCKYHTEIGIYSAALFVVMNKQKYESLPMDIRKIIDENSGEQMAVVSGRVFDLEDARAKKIAQDRGDFIYTLPQSELGIWKKITIPVENEWVDNMKAKGLPGQEVLAYVTNLLIEIQQ
jgi:TRAP-type C4-dicarboxylate transport system substrate-binding protein